MFKSFIHKIKANHWPVYGVEVFYQGRLKDRYFFKQDIRYPVYSATKSFVSTAAGIAVGEGKFSIEKPVYEYIRNEIPSGVTEESIDIIRKISIKRLLTMSVPGYPFRPEGDDWIKYVLNCTVSASVRPSFEYSNIPAYLVGVALENAVGEHLITYLNKRLFEPLNIENPEYSNCPKGHFYGATGMRLTVNELSRLGQLYMQNGMFQGRQILSHCWVKEATSVQQMNREGGYGYYFWKYRDGFRISGKWGQKCYVFPKQKLMVTYLADLREGSEQSVTSAMETEVLPEYGL